MPFDYKKFGREYEHPAWKQGRIAFKRGKKINDNPHDFGTDAYEAWNQGWHEVLTKQEKP